MEGVQIPSSDSFSIGQVCTEGSEPHSGLRGLERPHLQLTCSSLPGTSPWLGFSGHLTASLWSHVGLSPTLEDLLLLLSASYPWGLVQHSVPSSSIRESPGNPPPSLPLLRPKHTLGSWLAAWRKQSNNFPSPCMGRGLGREQKAGFNYFILGEFIKGMILKVWSWRSKTTWDHPNPRD